MPSPESAPKTTKNAMHTLICFAASFFIIDILLLALLIITGHNIFLLITNIYISNFVLIPAVAIIYAIWNIIRRKSFIANITISLISIILIGTFIYATCIEPANLKIEHLTIQTDKFSGEITVAHVTDFQSAKVGSYEESVIDKLVELSPDIIFHTGDMVQPYNRKDRQNELKALAVLFKKLNPKYGTYNVGGNLDNLQDSKPFDDTSGSSTLINENIVISDSGIELDILGLTFEQSFNGDKYAIRNWIRKSRGKFTILLGHAPDYVLDIRDEQIGLCLSGHTHGGQIRLPFIGALINASKTPKSWARGLTKFENTQLNVSAGIGCERAGRLPPIRFNCPPSISIIKIIGSKTD